ncbi:hypothetical protein FACS189487_10950 [Campylobacterota bacterium]|nr:hypothetical protein FACS189487_10950 [Campylobacterota bacterium]
MIYKAKQGERLDQICFRFYGVLGEVYLHFLEDQTKEILLKGELDAFDEIHLNKIEIAEDLTKGDPWA